jgi:ABC-2 type transport system ATP-binding protein
VLVETERLTKTYGDVHALEACSLEVARGEVFGLLGPNGAGKTTLIRSLMGYLRPTSGKARIDGLDCYRQRVQIHQRVSYLPADAYLFDNMKGRDVLRFFVEMREGGSIERSCDLAKRLELDTSRRVATMSTGMRQKLALVVCLSPDVPLLILDEPTANLDPSVRQEIMTLVSEAKAAGRTVIFSSHVLSEVDEVTDRVGILRAGRMVHLQTMSQLRQRHRITALLEGELPEAPEALRDELLISSEENGQLTIETGEDLSALLGWLSQLPLSQIKIEPVGLRAVYDQFHREVAS